MASNETIQSLATLLQALRGFNEPRREMEMYAKKSMLQLENEKSLAEFKYNIEKEKVKDKMEGTDTLLSKVKERERRAAGYDPERPQEILETGKETELPISGKEMVTLPGKGPVYGPAGFQRGTTGKGLFGEYAVADIVMTPDNAKTFLTRRALYDLSQNVDKFIEYEAEDAAQILPGSSREKEYLDNKNKLKESLLSIAESGETQNFNRYERKVYNELLDTLGD